MADLTITVANSETLITDKSPLSVVQYGEAVTPMQPLYRKSADGKYYKAKASGTAGICPRGDLTTGHRITILGVPTAATFLPINVHVTGAVVP